MNDAGIGLSRVQTDALKNLLKHIHRRTITCPFERSTLLLMGLNEIAEEGPILCGLEEKAVRALLVSVLAERKR